MRFALLLFATVWASALSAATAPRPSVLFILADNWSYPHASIHGEPEVRTPVFDRVAREGIRLSRAFCPVPSCSPTRSCLLTGRAAHQLEDAASLWSYYPRKLGSFIETLAAQGYRTGFMGKGWAPGNHLDQGRAENPAGPKFTSFAKFMDEQPATSAGEQVQPFFFWLGDTHTSLNKWVAGSGRKAGIDPAKVRVPACLPDVPEVREEIADYLASVQLIDTAAAEAVAVLEQKGLLDSTLIVFTSDNGWQMPRGLANCYDTGTHVPFAARWPGHIPAGRVAEEFVSLADLAPTFLTLAGVPVPAEMTAQSCAELLLGKPSATPRAEIFLERERHANVRAGNLSYPMRCIRTADFLYVRNLRPERWPAGDPEPWFAVGPFGDIDPSRTKAYLAAHAAEHPKLYELSFSKRPAEELYDLRHDPEQLVNVAAQPKHAESLQQLRGKVDAWMKATQDPRIDPAYDAWDAYPYFGGRWKGFAK